MELGAIQIVCTNRERGSKNNTRNAPSRCFPAGIFGIELLVLATARKTKALPHLARTAHCACRCCTDDHRKGSECGGGASQELAEERPRDLSRSCLELCGRLCVDWKSLASRHRHKLYTAPGIQCVEPENATRCVTHIRACARSASLQ